MFKKILRLAKCLVRAGAILKFCWLFGVLRYSHDCFLEILFSFELLK